MRKLLAMEKLLIVSLALNESLLLERSRLKSELEEATEQLKILTAKYGKAVGELGELANQTQALLERP
ncbi:MAG TPA: hypothetical protein VHP30_15245 [Ignavibacteriales bacterium]|nr:hypothetical protein [Ignavibacteriales bacterium]